MRQRRARGYTTNMTEGSAAGLLLRFMLPLLAGNIFQQVYSAADMVIVGRFIGADALAAVGATNSLNFLFFSLCNGLAGGLGIPVAQAFGANRPDTVKRLIVNGAYLMAAGAAAMGALGFALAGRVLALVNTPENIIGDSVVYMRLMCLGVIAVSLYNGVSAVLRGLGDSRTPLFFLVVSSILNVLLDLVFICAFGWGVGGAAAATILSQLVSALGCIAYALRHNPMFLFDRSSWRWDGTLIGRCCRLGVPLAAQSSMIALSLVALQSVVNGFGSVVGAAFTATSRVEVMAQQPFNSLFAALMTLLFEVFSPQIMGLFVDAGEASEVIAYGARGLRLTGWFLAPLGMIYVSRGILNGAGDSAYSLISGACEMTGRVAFPRPLTRLPAVGAMGIWLGTALTWTLVAAAGLIRYFSGAWRKKAAMQGAGNRD